MAYRNKKTNFYASDNGDYIEIPLVEGHNVYGTKEEENQRFILLKEDLLHIAKIISEEENTDLNTATNNIEFEKDGSIDLSRFESKHLEEHPDKRCCEKCCPAQDKGYKEGYEASIKVMKPSLNDLLEARTQAKSELLARIEEKLKHISMYHLTKHHHNNLPVYAVKDVLKILDELS